MLTRAEYRTHQQQLDELRRLRDRDLPELLREARTFVAEDAAEEIAQIREDHAFVDARIADLQALLRNANVVPEDEAAHVVSLGSAVSVEFPRTGKTKTYRLVGTGGWAGPQTASAGSPVGHALLGRAVGDVTSIEYPDGRVETVRVIAVAPAEPETEP